MTEILSLSDAERLAERTMQAIDLALMLPDSARIRSHYRADRERVPSDLAGLRLMWTLSGVGGAGTSAWMEIAGLFSDGLRRTAALYGAAL